MMLIATVIFTEGGLMGKVSAYKPPSRIFFSLNISQFGDTIPDHSFALIDKLCKINGDPISQKSVLITFHYFDVQKSHNSDNIWK